MYFSVTEERKYFYFCYFINHRKNKLNLFKKQLTLSSNTMIEKPTLYIGEMREDKNIYVIKNVDMH